MFPITIVGSGLAAYAVAREFRKLDKESPLRIITNDNGYFYSKPMLSNAFHENKTPENLVITPVEKMATQINAEILNHTKVTQINSAEYSIVCGNKSLKYSQLVLALGAEQIRLPLAGNAVDKILSINDLNDYTQFRGALKNTKRIAIMGAGLIGCEFANDLQPAGFEVTLIDPLQHALGRLVPKEIAVAVQEALQALGVKLYFEKAVNRVDYSAENIVFQLTLSDGSLLETDMVLSAVGLRPNTELAKNAGLSVNKGIVVDRYLKTTAKDVYALGDCAEVEGLILPFVMPLMNSARAIAKSLTGAMTKVNYPAMPVAVKTPACPIVLCLPANTNSGKWKIEGEGQNIRALLYSPTEELSGFILTGTKITEKTALVKKLPPMLPSSL
jgi:rubredoxin-NAD+ reductase